MPAQGRGAFLTPRAPAKPAPRKQAIPAPHPLASVIHHVVQQATHAVEPATRAASQVQPRQITRGASRAASRTAAAVGRPSPRVFPANVRKAGGSPLLDAGTLRAALLEAADAQRLRAGTSQLPGLHEASLQARRPAPRPEGGSPLAALLLNPGAAITQGYSNLLGTSGVTGAIGTVLGRSAGDIASIGNLPLVAGYEGAGAVKQSVEQGSLSPVGHLLSELGSGVAHGALGELVQGHLSAAGEAAAQHPVYALTELLGATGVAGRASGALARAAGSSAAEGGVRGALARAGSTVRSPINLSEDAGGARTNYRRRTFSKDLTRKGIQVLADRTRAPTLDRHGRQVRVIDRGRITGVREPRSKFELEHLGRNVGNFRARVGQDTENRQREIALQKVVAAASKSGKGRIPPLKGRAVPIGRTGLSVAKVAEHLAVLAATGVIKTAKSLPADLAKRIAEIKDAIAKDDFRTVTEREHAEGNLRVLGAAQSPKVLAQAERIVKHGERAAVALNEADRQLHEGHIYPRDQLKRAALSEYAFAHMGAKHDGERIVGPDGAELTDRAIEMHARAEGRNPDTLAYLPHRLAAQDKRSHHKQLRPGGRPTAGGERARTGTLRERGANTIDPAVIRDELTSKLTTVGRARTLDKMVSETGQRLSADHAAWKHLTDEEHQQIVKQDGYLTPKQADEIVNRLHGDRVTDQLIPMRAFGAKLSKGSQDALKKELSPGEMETLQHGLLQDRLPLGDARDQTANVVLAPKAQVDEMVKQLSPAGDARKWLQLMNTAFRYSVLPQPRWLVGNFVEPYLIRLPLSGSGLVNLPGLGNDIRIARKFISTGLKSTDPAVRQGMEEYAAVIGHGLFVGPGRLTRRSYEDFHGVGGRVLQVGHNFRQIPPVKQITDLLLAIPKTFFAVNKHLIEDPASLAVFGKFARNEIQASTGSWTKAMVAGEKAVADAQKGLVNTPAQHAFAETLYEQLGQYGGFRPSLRRAQQGLFPFFPWTLAALRFAYWTLPAHHTVAFSALMKVGQQVIGKWEAEHADLPPGTLRAGFIQPDKGVIDFTRYTPAGVTQPLSELGKKGVSAESAIQPLLGVVAPQFSGAQNALGGLDPFNRSLEVSGGDHKPHGLQTLGIAANSLLEALIPGLAYGRRLREGGGTAYANSTALSPQVKPGTSHQSAVNRTFNPFRETYLKGPSLTSSLPPSQRHEVEQAEAQAKAYENSPVVQAEIRRAEEEAKRASR